MAVPAEHPALAPVIDRALRAFEALTGRAPRAVACAPGRVNLIGEHTDYNDGFVLPMAIDRWCVAAGGPGSGLVRSDDLGKQVVYDPALANAAALPPWARYPVGVIWKMTEPLPAQDRPSLDIAIASSVPLGSGLSSSASIELATASLVDRLLDQHRSPEELARIGRAAEHEYAGVPCGIMDQLISACAEPHAAMLIDCRTLARTPVPLPPDCAIVMADSGVRHALASGEYARRRASCEAAARAMGLAALRDADLGLLERSRGLLQGDQFVCARHVITENARVLGFIDALRAGDLARAGELMYASHESLRTDYRVSCDELDALVAAAKRVPGVYGSRMTGGGFGGCTVTLCRADAAARLCEGLAGGPPSARPPFQARAVAGATAWTHA